MAKGAGQAKDRQCHWGLASLSAHRRIAPEKRCAPAQRAEGS
ncbi:Unknown protein sequence [Pseudomonas syringae pv. cilantro]|uniref:Uncharacterized protein n=2 Tax=Pseudomonas syringae group TaxID=136849 RepID=A0A0N0GCH1_PSESX|nr:Unknown protein sequence [Pseudomonas syringae pv. maculicola]KPC24625.1 Unknown protein sequence [Pseudomonas syringae pv. cilantro]RMO78478.1 hypothetical protein ALQ33_102143 [Pseudomonas syringae pv. philadelphi]